MQHDPGTEFQYSFGLTHGKTPEASKEKGLGNFDLVVLSGLLYRRFGPLHTLGMARSLVRAGGLMIVETFAALDEQSGMLFSAGGRFTANPARTSSFRSRSSSTSCTASSCCRSTASTDRSARSTATGT